MSRSYAEAVASPEETRNQLTSTKITRINQTFILYKISPDNITINEVITDISKSLEVEAATAIFGVHRDTRYRSRFTVVFKNRKFIEQITENSLQVGDTTIAPKRPKPTRGYLPNLPVYALEEEVSQLLSKHGKVTGIYPRTRNDGIRIGGWNFFIHLDHIMPNFLHYDNEPYEIIHAGKVKKQTITTEKPIPPPPTPQHELLPFPESPITILVETNTPPIRTPKKRAPSEVNESEKGKQRRIRKKLRIETEEILENTAK